MKPYLTLQTVLTAFTLLATWHYQTHSWHFTSGFACAMLFASGYRDMTEPGAVRLLLLANRRRTTEICADAIQNSSDSAWNGMSDQWWKGYASARYQFASMLRDMADGTLTVGSVTAEMKRREEEESNR